MGRSEANKYIFKDGLLKVAFKNISFKKVHLGENFPVKFLMSIFEYMVCMA